MKILLLMPQGPKYRRGAFFGKSLRYAPLTLSTLAALVPDELDAEITCLDEGTDTFDPRTCDYYDVVGITCITGTSPRAYEFSQILRERGMYVVLGGVHPTLCPDEAMRNADSIVTGYAEETWPQLLQDVVEGKAQKRYEQSKLYRFSSVPEPRRDLLNQKGYFTMNTVQAVRGCPYKCNFCVVPVAWPQYLHRPIPEVIAEIEKLKGNTFLFLDLSPIEDKAYIKKLYRELIPLKRYWGGLATMKITEDVELRELASKSGCRGLLLGIESVNPNTLKQMRKGFNKPQEYAERIKILHDLGIAVNGCFVLGLDDDDPDIFERTVEFAMETAIDLPRYAVATPFPGTPLYHELNGENRILTQDWSYYDGQTVVFNPKGMSAEQLHEGVRWAWKQTYSLPSIFKRVTQSTATRNWKVLMTSPAVNLGYRLYSAMLPKYMPIPCEAEPWLKSEQPTFLK